MPRFIFYTFHSYSMLRLSIWAAAALASLILLHKTAVALRRPAPIPVNLFDDPEILSDEVIVVSCDGSTGSAQEIEGGLHSRGSLRFAAALLCICLLTSINQSIRTQRIMKGWRDAEEKLANRDYEGALRTNKKTINLDPACGWSHQLMARAHLALKDLEHAAAELTLATRNNYNNAEPYIELGGCLTRLNRYSEAEIAFRTACNIAPSNARARVLLGQCVAAQNHINEAVSIMRYALQLDAANPQAHTGLGILLFAQGESDEALTHLKRAVELSPQNISAHNALGTIYAAQKKYDMASIEFQTEISLEPQFSAGYFNLATTLDKMGDKPRALKAYQAYLRRCTLKPDGTLTAAPAAIDAIRRLKGLPHAPAFDSKHPRHDVLVMRSKL